MSTRSVTLSKSDWMQVTTALSGCIENQSGETAIYRSAATKPAANEETGHLIRNEALIGFARDTTEPIFARTFQNNGLFIVTED